MNSAVATRPGDLVVDAVVDVFSVRPRELPCARCGRTLAAHAGDPPDCTGFVQPALPPTYAYIDQLQRGDAFQFMTLQSHASTRVASRAAIELDTATGLLQLESHTPDSNDVIHVVDPNTIVHRVIGTT